MLEHLADQWFRSGDLRVDSVGSAPAWAGGPLRISGASCFMSLTVWALGKLKTVLATSLWDSKYVNDVLWSVPSMCLKYVNIAFSGLFGYSGYSQLSMGTGRFVLHSRCWSLSLVCPESPSLQRCSSVLLLLSSRFWP